MKMKRCISMSSFMSSVYQKKLILKDKKELYIYSLTYSLFLRDELRQFIVCKNNHIDGNHLLLFDRMCLRCEHRALSITSKKKNSNQKILFFFVWLATWVHSIFTRWFSRILTLSSRLSLKWLTPKEKCCHMVASGRKGLNNIKEYLNNRPTQEYIVKENKKIIYSCYDIV